ncbi:MAG: prepilin peptidase [Patescibacteria group bacterium]|jgi:prepilin signal peptidase PulO-like enzyme (type II secretory pathway)
MEKIFFELPIFIFGASIGSFLNVLIDRLPKEESINGRSHCDFCGKKISWYDLIPVLSFFILRGKTRCCRKKLSWQYPLIEILTGISSLLVFNFQFPIFNFQTLILFGIISCLIVIFVSDLKYHLISDYILLALFIFVVLLHVVPTRVGTPLLINEILKQVQNDIISSLVVGFPIFLIYFLSKERAMGLGDVYLTAIMGLLLGWQKGFLALYIAFITGAIFGLMVILFKHKKLKSKIAFGPFLVIGTVIMLFWGNNIFEIIRKTYGF